MDCELQGRFFVLQGDLCQNMEDRWRTASSWQIDAEMVYFRHLRQFLNCTLHQPEMNIYHHLVNMVLSNLKVMTAVARLSGVRDSLVFDSLHNVVATLNYHIRTEADAARYQVMHSACLLARTLLDHRQAYSNDAVYQEILGHQFAASQEILVTTTMVNADKIERGLEQDELELRKLIRIGVEAQKRSLALLLAMSRCTSAGHDLSKLWRSVLDCERYGYAVKCYEEKCQNESQGHRKIQREMRHICLQLDSIVHQLQSSLTQVPMATRFYRRRRLARLTYDAQEHQILELIKVAIETVLLNLVHCLHEWWGMANPARVTDPYTTIVRDFSSVHSSTMVALCRSATPHR